MGTDAEREAAGWKLLITEPFENYLGAAAKQHGDSVIIKMKKLWQHQSN